MFLNLRPYLTWLGIMLTSNPESLQSNINRLTQPPTVVTRPPPSSTSWPLTTVTTQATTTIGSQYGDFFNCLGQPVGRYSHSKDCSKYFVCLGGATVVPASSCPVGLLFSTDFLVCTIPEDAGCTYSEEPAETSTSPIPTTPLLPPDSAWLAEVQASNFPNPVNNDQITIYYENDTISQNSSWLTNVTRTMWNKVVDNYIGSRDFALRDKLYIVFRQNPVELPSYSTFLDSSRGYINAIEVSSQDWSLESPENSDMVATNIAKIISKSARGTRYPFPEPYWEEILVYDLYNTVGRIQDRDRWSSSVQQDMESNFATIPMFSEWYLPIYDGFGRTPILNKFFITRSANFPKSPGNSSVFARRMNRGEFVHFWSFAVGANLTSLASQVFGWTDNLSRQYENATVEFSFNY